MTARRVLVTGATGLIGYAIVEAALRRGYHVRALVRDPEAAKQRALRDVELVKGDILEPETLAPALRGVDTVFHAAGMPEQWQRDETVFDRVNRQGTKNVLEASLAEGVSRVVYTSTMDVFAAPRGGTLVETHVDEQPKPTACERSKQDAEREAAAIERRGLDLVYINPGATYGPSLRVGGLNRFFERLLKGEIRLLPPGGVPIAFTRGLAEAHLTAGDRGRRGEHYLIADARLSMGELAALALSFAAQGGRVPPVGSEWLLHLLANISAPIARVMGFEPFVAPGVLTSVLWQPQVDSTKAQRELGFTPCSPSDGIRTTIEWLQRRADNVVPSSRRLSA